MAERQWLHLLIRLVDQRSKILPKHDDIRQVHVYI